MTIGIIREGKTPPDKRVPFTPEQAALLQEKFGVKVWVQPSPIRCFKDQEYENAGVELREDLSECDYLFGVKEVPINQLIPEKKYFFFSHTIKEQPYNKNLMLALLEQKIQMIDYECLRNQKGQRLLGFGRYAGIVGAYNALLAYGQRTGAFQLKAAHLCADQEELKQELKKLDLTQEKIVLTGGGRVAHGSVELLQWAGIKQVEPEAFLTQEFKEPVFVNLDCEHYYYLPGQNSFSYDHFFKNSKQYRVNFVPYLKKSDIFISGHFWDNESAPLFESKVLSEPDFKTQVIADITCDIEGSVPTTLRATTIAEPLFYLDKKTLQEVKQSDSSNLTVMSVDNLPCELPADASRDFGAALIEHVIPAILEGDPQAIITRASICAEGKLTDPYQYLSSFATPEKQ